MNPLEHWFGEQGSSFGQERCVMTDTKRPTVTIREACEIAHVSRRTIYNWLQADKLSYVRTAGGARRIFTDTLFRGVNGEVLNPSAPLLGDLNAETH